MKALENKLKSLNKNISKEKLSKGRSKSNNLDSKVSDSPSKVLKSYLVEFEVVDINSFEIEVNTCIKNDKPTWVSYGCSIMELPNMLLVALKSLVDIKPCALVSNMVATCGSYTKWLDKVVYSYNSLRKK